MVQFPHSAPRFDQLLHKNIFGGKKFYGRQDRQDAVLFNFNGLHRLGIIHSIYAQRRQFQLPSTCHLVLISFLQKVSTDPGKDCVLTVYGHRRYRFCLSDSNFIMMALVQAKDLVQPEMVVVDQYWLRHAHGVFETVSEVEKHNENRSQMAFFRLKSFLFYEKIKPSLPSQ